MAGTITTSSLNGPPTRGTIGRTSATRGDIEGSGPSPLRNPTAPGGIRGGLNQSVGNPLTNTVADPSRSISL